MMTHTLINARRPDTSCTRSCYVSR